MIQCMSYVSLINHDVYFIGFAYNYLYRVIQLSNKTKRILFYLSDTICINYIKVI
jgi:hypothetical protein